MTVFEPKKLQILLSEEKTISELMSGDMTQNIEDWFNMAIGISRTQTQCEGGYITDEYILTHNVCAGRIETHTEGYIVYFEDNVPYKLTLNCAAIRALKEVEERLLIEDEYYDNRSEF